MHSISRKITFLFVSAFMLSLVVGSGCNKDSVVEPKTNESLEGSWRLTSVTLKGTPVGDMTLPAAQFLELSGTGATTSTMQFNEDGSAAVTTTYEEGDKLVIVGAGIDDTVPYAIDGSTLTLTIILPIDFASDGNPVDTEIDMVYTKL